MGALTWSVGQKLTAARLNLRIPITALKTADTAITSDTSDNADAELVLTLKAGVTYDLIGTLLVIAASATPDIKFGWAWTNTASVVMGDQGLIAGVASGTSSDLEAAARQADTATPTSDVAYGVTKTLHGIQLLDRVIVASAADSVFTLMWSQNTSSADSLTLKASSHVTAIPIG